jgi:hypothetical protein
MSRLLRVGDKVINLDNIEYIIREDDGVVRYGTSKGRRSVSGCCLTPSTVRALAKAGRSRKLRPL